MTRVFGLAACISALSAGAVFAGSITEYPADPAVPYYDPAPAIVSWTGFSVGAQGGWSLIDSNNIGVGGTGILGGLNVGYDYDFGKFVGGMALEHNWADIDITPAVRVDALSRLKLRGGAKFGSGLLYGTAGYANVDTNVVGDDDGYFIGGGYETQMMKTFSVGGEVIYQEFDNINNTAVDLEMTTFQAFAKYRF